MANVVITGIGVVSAFGLGVAANEAAWREGRSALEPIMAGADLAVGRVRGLDTASILPDPRQLPTMSESAELACWSGSLALRDAGIAPRSDVLANAGLFLGFWYERRTLEDYLSIARASIDRHTKKFDVAKMLRVGLKSQPPYTLLRSLASVGAFSIQMGIKGPNAALGTTPIAGGQALGAGLDAIRCAETELAIVGGTDCQTDLFEATEHGYLGPLRTRDGMQIGPGDAAGMLVLEDATAAARAGRRAHGQLLGYGERFFPNPEHAAEPSADGIARTIEACIADASDSQFTVDCVLYDDIIAAEQMDDALRAAGVAVPAAAIKRGTYLAGDMLAASMPWMIAIALSSNEFRGTTLVCDYGASGHYCAALVKRSS